MKPNFNNPVFSTDYSGQTTRALVRAISDIYSTLNCNMNEAKRYGAEYSEGQCVYCGRLMYELTDNNIPVFNKDLQYDHLFPASEFNLFTRGNVVISCYSCNSAKSSKNPIEYNNERIREGLPTKYSPEDFELFVEEVSSIYKKDYPEISSIGMSGDYENINPAKVIKELFLPKMQDMTLSPILPSWKTSNNLEIWEAVEQGAKDKYGDSMTVNDVVSRLTFTSNFFDEMYGARKITDCSVNEIINFGQVLLFEKRHSVGEVTKYRALLSILFDVLNKDMSDAMFSAIPTYAELRDNENLK